MMVLACRLALMPSTGKQHYGGVVMAIAAGLIAFTFANPCIAASSAGGMLFLLKAQGQIPGIGIVEEGPGPLVEQGHRVANLRVSKIAKSK